KLRRSQIQILDSGPLHGSGLRDIAEQMFDGEFEDQKVAGGVAVVHQQGGRSGEGIAVLTEKDGITLVGYQADNYKDFDAFWMAPDGSCLLVLTKSMRVQAMMVDDLIPPPRKHQRDHDPATLYILPIPRTFSTNILPSSGHHKPSTNGAATETSSADYV